ncbi:MAG: GntR family transcriptional regulator [Lawsonibacter sp.]
MFNSSNSLKLSVYEAMRASIISGHIPLSSRIIEMEYTSLFNVSRTPVRYAIQRLTREGFLEVMPQGGTYVTLPLLRDLEEYSRIQDAFYDLIIKHAVENITDKEIEKLGYIINHIRQLLEYETFISNYPQLSELCGQFHDRIVEIANQPGLAAMRSDLPDYWHILCINPYLDKNILYQSFCEHAVIFDALRNRNMARTRELHHQHIVNSTNNRKLAYIRLLAKFNPSQRCPYI